MRSVHRSWSVMAIAFLVLADTGAALRGLARVSDWRDRGSASFRQASSSGPGQRVVKFPADGAAGVSPDTHLVLTFPSEPALGSSGQIRIYDAADHRLVDTLDLAVPPGPTQPAPRPNPPYTPTPYEYGATRPTNADTTPGTPSGAAVPTPRATTSSRSLADSATGSISTP